MNTDWERRAERVVLEAMPCPQRGDRVTRDGATGTVTWVGSEPTCHEGTGRWIEPTCHEGKGRWVEVIWEDYEEFCPPALSREVVLRVAESP